MDPEKKTRIGNCQRILLFNKPNGLCVPFQASPPALRGTPNLFLFFPRHISHPYRTYLAICLLHMNLVGTRVTLKNRPLATARLDPPVEKRKEKKKPAPDIDT